MASMRTGASQPEPAAAQRSTTRLTVVNSPASIIFSAQWVTSRTCADSSEW